MVAALTPAYYGNKCNYLGLKPSIGEFASVTNITVRHFEKMEAKLHGFLTSTLAVDE
jgi:hypothetical protein